MPEIWLSILDSGPPTLSVAPGLKNSDGRPGSYSASHGLPQWLFGIPPSLPPLFELSTRGFGEVCGGNVEDIRATKGMLSSESLSPEALLAWCHLRLSQA
uniref:Uncharacterized protein n=1 Tax=Magallana gigas TaxID=29159 RepID=K1QLM1_MAGGI